MLVLILRRLVGPWVRLLVQIVEVHLVADHLRLLRRVLALVIEAAISPLWVE